MTPDRTNLILFFAIALVLTYGSLALASWLERRRR